jgi:hypothetical protein
MHCMELVSSAYNGVALNYHKIHIAAYVFYQRISNVCISQLYKRDVMEYGNSYSFHLQNSGTTKFCCNILHVSDNCMDRIRK